MNWVLLFSIGAIIMASTPTVHTGLRQENFMVIDIYYKLLEELQEIVEHLKSRLTDLNGSSRSFVKQEFDRCTKLMNELDVIATSIERSLKPKEKLFSQNHAYEMNRLNSFCRQLKGQLFGISPEPKGVDDILPQDSASQVSLKSKRSGVSATSKVSSIMMKEEQRQAELVARLSSVQEQHRLSLARVELQKQEEELKLRTELRASAARMEAINRLLEQSHAPPVDFGKPDVFSAMDGSPPVISFGRSHPSVIEDRVQVKNSSAAKDGINFDDFMNNVEHFLSDVQGITVANGDNGVKNAQNVPTKDVNGNQDVRVQGAVVDGACNAQNVQVPGVVQNTGVVSQCVNGNELDRKLNVNAPCYVPRANCTESFHEVLDAVADKLVSRDCLPKMMPEEFEGDVLGYPSWVQAFESIIERNCVSVSQRLFYLGKCTKGEAKRAIQGYLVLNTEESYAKARQVLQKRYGDKYLLARECKMKLKDWPVMKYGDGKGLRDLSDFLMTCKATMETTSHLASLDSEEEISKLADKLPKGLIDRWYRITDQWLNGGEESQQRYPPFGIFCDFLEKESRIACSSLQHSTDKTSANNTQKKTFSRSLSTQVEDDAGTKVQMKTCVMCNDTHELEACRQFQRLTLQERLDFLRKKGYCFGCINGRHLSRTCTKRKTCKICESLHPTLLHDDNFKREKAPVKTDGACDNAAIVHHAKTSGCRDSQETICKYNCMILPVTVRHKNNVDKAVRVYAVLDDQSNTSFVTPGTLKKLGLDGEPVQIKLSTMTNHEVVDSKVIHGLCVSGNMKDNQDLLALHATYVRDIPTDTSLIPTPEVAERWQHLTEVAKEIPHLEDLEVGMLIGLDCPRALKPMKVVLGSGDDPWAVKTVLGWGIIGMVRPPKTMISLSKDSACKMVFRTTVKEVSPLTVHQMFDRDFGDCAADGKRSLQDQQFLDKVSEAIHQTTDGHFEIPLPLKKGTYLPNNRKMVVERLKGLQKRLQRDKAYKRDYVSFMEDMIQRGYAELAPPKTGEDDGRTWYIPHHGVYHPKKGKFRLVFDCSAEFQGESLNRQLLQGPNLTNDLVGVLCRFRKERTAISCDVEGMFHQVRVNQEDRNFLKFLWWKDGNMDAPPLEYRMTVHLFGATSSPGCANFALKTTADMSEAECSTAAATFLRRDFYVDDGLTSVKTQEEAKELIEASHRMCNKGGFNLRKFLCNNKAVLNSVPKELRAENVKDIDMEKILPIERTLGIEWCVESDTLQFRIQVKEKPLTRRGILSTVSSIYDPLGLISPFLLVGKTILQELVRDGKGWDEPVPDSIVHRWERWKGQLPQLAEISIPRCYKNKDFGSSVKTELHHFSDASLQGYGQCSYLRQIDEEGRISCALVMGKARVPPTKVVTVPRLELAAAVMSVKTSSLLERELVCQNEGIQHFYWTDSQVVLGYIKNEARRFHIFVSNRIQQIHDHSNVESWHYVETTQNPADLASRGLSVEELKNSTQWWKGPNFLRDQEEFHFANDTPPVDKNDPEVKKVQVKLTGLEEHFDLLSRLKHISEWTRAKRAVALCLGLKRKLKAKRNQETSRDIDVIVDTRNTESLQEAERLILKACQESAFPKALKVLRERNVYAEDRKACRDRNDALKKNGGLYRLDPLLDSDELIHVGGRLRRANVPKAVQHPVVIPKQGIVTRMIIDYFHRKMQHSGSGMTLNEIRASGFWIINARSTINRQLRNCVTCKKLRGITVTQKMADLPEDRMETVEPFTYSAVDYFGPFYIKEGRSLKKRWGVLFTCMSSRAIHIETANSLTTGSFLNAYRRFVGRRGTVRQLRSDRGTNFVGVQSELEAALSQIDSNVISRTLLKDSCDWIDFKMNFPNASHMGGIWERMVRSVRNLLVSLMSSHGENLDDEQLNTFMVEAESIVNSRPVTYPDMSSPNSVEPLTPYQILTLKSKVVRPPPGIFVKEDLYYKKRWRVVQYLADQFWNRWRSEYLLALQERSKWNRQSPNLEVDDVVLIKDEHTARSVWPMARVTKVFPSEDGLVRKVEVKTSSGHYERPVNKLVLLVPRDSQSESH